MFFGEIPGDYSGEVRTMDMNTMICAVIGSGVLSTVINQICNAVNRHAERQSGQIEATRLVLKDRLRFLCVRYIEQGWIYEDELEDLITMHACYHNKLNGNGYLDTLMEKVKNLEVRGVGM